MSDRHQDLSNSRTLVWEFEEDDSRFQFFKIGRDESSPRFESYDARGFISTGDLFRQGRVTTMVCRHHLKTVFDALEHLNSVPNSAVDLYCAECAAEALAASS